MADIRRLLRIPRGEFGDDIRPWSRQCEVTAVCAEAVIGMERRRIGRGPFALGVDRQAVRGRARLKAVALYHAPLSISPSGSMMRQCFRSGSHPRALYMRNHQPLHAIVVSLKAGLSLGSVSRRLYSFGTTVPPGMELACPE